MSANAPAKPAQVLWEAEGLGQRVVRLPDGTLRAEQLTRNTKDGTPRWRTRIPVNLERQIRDRAIVELAHQVKRATTPPPALVVARCVHCDGAHTAADVLSGRCPHCRAGAA